ncbi:RNA recognition motif domain-containing protein [Verrucomicrobiota bacterium]
MIIGYPFQTIITLYLAWFLLGIVVGRRLPQKAKRKSRRSESSHRRNSGVTEIYVGNLSYDVGEKDLKKTFEKYGKVLSARVIINKFNGKSKGYGFVEMKDKGASGKAVNALNGLSMKGRRIVVNEAKSQFRR